MNIGILTFHRAHNYGAVLQCYSLSKTLEQLGHKVEVIDYLSSKFGAEYALYPNLRYTLRQNAGKTLRLLTAYKHARQRYNGFNAFIERLPLSKPYEPGTRSVSGYDAVVFGSDQIWNPRLTKGIDPLYAGDLEKNGTRFVAYAAGTTPKVLNKHYEPYFRGILQRFDAITTREASLCRYLNHLQPGVAREVLDPVLLQSPEAWERMADAPGETNYLLIYTVHESPGLYHLARKLAKERQLKVVEIRPDTKKGGLPGALRAETPEAFVGWFAKASFILTNSFHGTAFAALFNKPFFTLSINKAFDDRSASLLDKLGLAHRLVAAHAPLKAHPDLDFTAPNEALARWKQASLEALVQMLS